MKRFPRIIAATLLSLTAMAQTNAPIDNFALVTNLWHNGYKTNVLAFAEQRLAANSNDLAGLILVMEYNLAFTNIESFSNDVARVMVCARNCTGTTFSNHYQKVEEELRFFLLFLKDHYRPTPERILTDKTKALIIHKRMTYEDYLKWLHDDGLF